MDQWRLPEPGPAVASSTSGNDSFDDRRARACVALGAVSGEQEGRAATELRHTMPLLRRTDEQCAWVGARVCRNWPQISGGEERRAS